MNEIVAVVPEILLYIVPGYITQKIIETFTPRKQLPEFDTTLWSVFYSFLVAIAVNVFKWVYISVGFGTSFLSDEDVRNVLKIALYIIFSIALGFAIVKLNKSKFGYQVVSTFNENMEPGEDLITEMLKARNGQWARVIMRDGMVYYGTLIKFTCNPDASARFIVLSRYKWGPMNDVSQMNDTAWYKVIDNFNADTTENREETVMINYADIVALQLHP